MSDEIGVDVARPSRNGQPHRRLGPQPADSPRANANEFWSHPAYGPFQAPIVHPEKNHAPQIESEPGFMAGFVHFDVPVKPLGDEDVRTAFPLLDSLPHPVLWIDKAHQIYWSNAAAQSQYHPTTGKCYAVSHQHHRPCVHYGEACPMRAATELGTAVSVAHVHQAGVKTKFFEVTAVPILGGGIVEIHIPVEDFFGVDALTGVRTRAFFEQATRRALALMQRIELPFVLVMIDLDRFKQLNDRHGHPAGDLILQAIGKAITDNIRGTDSAGRWGGDEFCVFLPGIDHDGGMQLVGRIQEAIRSIRLRYRGNALTITASFGMHSSICDYSFIGAVRRADSALYRAKEFGRDCIEIW